MSASAVARPLPVNTTRAPSQGAPFRQSSGAAAVAPHAAFATRAQAALLDGLGWRITASARRDEAYHAPLRCCLVLRDGAREEAAFGYTGLTAPLDGENPTLRAAQIRVERFLAQLGEDSGVLLQNTPLIAFGGKRRDRVAVFGGWRFHDRVWRPFMLAPDGLGGVGIQNTFFEAQTAPHHMAEVFGAPADLILPKISDLVAAIADYDPKTGGATGKVAPGLRIVPHQAGWSVARSGTAAALMPLRLKNGKIPAKTSTGKSRQNSRSEPQTARPAYARGVDGAPLNPLAPSALPWEIGEDEFRFRHLQMEQA